MSTELVTSPTEAVVLYVDDDEANQVVFSSSFGAFFATASATSGAQALELMRRREVAVLLTDQRMPGMSGVELMEKVREEFPDTVRLMITAYADIQSAMDAINRGQAHGYLQKPWNTTDLATVLSQSRARYAMTRQLKELELRFTATERLYALGVIAAGVAHELRGPLSAVTMCLELIRTALREEQQFERMKAQVSRSLADADQGLNAMVDIVSSIELSTRSRGEASVDMRAVTELAARSVTGEARRRGTLALQLRPVSPVTGSQGRLGQVVMNLLVNALEALDPARRTENLVTVELSEHAAQAGHGGEVVLAVSDNGPGIPDDVVGHIFDPFFTTKREGGTGLGLAISQKIVSEHGGTITVETTPGRGTRFEVRLPALP